MSLFQATHRIIRSALLYDENDTHCSKTVVQEILQT